MNAWMNEFIDDPTNEKKIKFFTSLIENITECTIKTNAIELALKDLIKATEAGEIIRRID